MLFFPGLRGTLRQFLKIFQIAAPAQIVFPAIYGNGPAGAKLEIVCVGAFNHIAAFLTADCIPNNMVHVFLKT